tara:strand:+ start:48930 stop:50087 length:1158 start_codon:yes stop_codon:yes gene_type:complete
MIKNKKIAIIDSVAARGGSHHFYLFGQSIGLIDQGLNVRLYTNDITDDPKIKGLSIKNYYKGIFNKKSRFIAGFFYLIGSIRSIFGARIFGARICHYHLFHVNSLVVFDLLLTKFLGMKVVYTVHDVISNLEKNEGSFRWINYVLNKSDKLITHNEYSKQEMIRLFKGIDKEIHIIPHGNYMPFITIKNDQNKSRNKLGLPKHKKVLLFFGMIKRVKGLDLLLKSMQIVIKNNPDIFLLIAGKSWEDDFNLYNEMIENLGIKDNCIVHNKYIKSEHVADYFCSADISVLPYKRISQSGVLMMSMSYNCPVLVSNLLPFTEIINDDITGYIFESENINSLSQKILSIFSNEKSLIKCKDLASNEIKTKYSWNEIGRKMKNIYEKIN